MGVNLRRLKPDALFDSFLGILDIKLGAEIILLFALINKVAGVYGFITVIVGGTFTQLTFYGYSIITLFILSWALKVIKAESTNSTLLVAHLYALDHVIQSLFHYLFYYDYWYLQPHDGRRSINSKAQQDLIDLAVSRGEIADPSTQEANNDLRAALALEIWEKERVFANWTVVVGFCLKVYFILVLYSYAAHLRSSTYHALPLTAKPRSSANVNGTTRSETVNGNVPEGQGLLATNSTGEGAARREGDRPKVSGYVENEEEFDWD